MSDAAYFSAFSEPPLGAHARRLRCIDRERKKCLVDGKQEREREKAEEGREESTEREKARKGGGNNRETSFIMSLNKRKKKEKIRDGGNAIYDGLIQEQIAEACVNIS